MPALGKLADVLGSYDPKPGYHYHLSCFVRAGGTTPSPFEGWATFGTIWQRRPDRHRFAIVRRLCLVPEHGAVVNRLDDRWACWDLYDAGVIDRMSRAVAIVRPPLPIRVHESEDALIMWALHHA